jgi:hypothetical protein
MYINANFKTWMVFNENVDQNWDYWCDTLEKYSKNKPNENRVLILLKEIISTDINVDLKTLLKSNRPDVTVFIHDIKTVLKEKNIENYNWFCFALGCLVSYSGLFHTEDLEAAVDETKRRIDSRELLKSEIGEKGWLVLGYESKRYVDEAIERSQRLSNKEKERMRKEGRTLREDPRLIQIIAKEEDLKLYLCPGLSYEDTQKNPELISERHGILCKYGKGGKFCTAQPEGTYHRNYVRNDIYIFHVDNEVKYQFVSCNNTTNKQFMTTENIPARYLSAKDYMFLNKHAPINCYSLLIDINYKDVIDTIKRGDAKEINSISLNQIEKYLIDSFENENIEDSELLLSGAFYLAKDKIKHFSIPALGDGRFYDKIISKILTNPLGRLDTGRGSEIVLNYIKSESRLDIFKKSNLDNLKNIVNNKYLNMIFSMTLSNYPALEKNILEVLNKNSQNEQECIEILCKLDTPPLKYLIGLSENVKKTISLLKDKLDKLSVSDIVELLFCSLSIKSTGKQIGEALGKKIVSKIPNEDIDKLITRDYIVLRNELIKSKSAREMYDDNKLKGFLEAIAMQHENLTKENIVTIIRNYTTLPGMHKGMSKIEEMLGKKNMKKLTKLDRWVSFNS